MKKGETKGVREDRLSGMMPDPSRLSAVSRSPLVRAGSRRLSFARGLSRGRGRSMAAADTLAFIESLYGEKFKAVEGGAFSLDKVYRTTGGGLFVSETRLSVSVHPRFDLRLINVAGGRATSQVFFQEAPRTTALTLLTHSGMSGHAQRRDASHVSNSVVFSPSLTVQAWNVQPSGAGRVSPTLSYVSVRGQRARKSQGLETSRPEVRVERLMRDGVTTRADAETTRATDAPAPTVFRLTRIDAVNQPPAVSNVAPSVSGLRLTSLDLRQSFLHAPRQEFVNVLLKTYLPSVVSREVLSAWTTGELLSAPPRRAAAQGETERRFASAPVVMQERRQTAWTYAEPAPRHATSGTTVEIRREFRSTETLREHGTALHTSVYRSARDTRPPLLQVLPPASLLSSLSETYLTLFERNVGHITYQSSGRTHTPSLQLLRTHRAPSYTREGSAAVDVPRLLLERTPRLQTTITRDVLSSLHTFVERVHSTVAGAAHAGTSTFFTRTGFETTLRRGPVQTSARQRGSTSHAARSHAAPSHTTSSHTTSSHTTSINLFGLSAEFVRRASVAEFVREASTRDVGTQVIYDRAPGAFSTQGVSGAFSTQGVPGAGTFLFATRLLGRTAGVSNVAALSNAAALSQTAATALRLAAAAVEAERPARETRAARPEGMALELIRHRREQVLQLPQPGYVFTQPARTQLEERQVVTKASREEIVEVVRKEVRSLTSSTHATHAPSRADLAGIADEVYSTLVRRLLVEKERLGRF